MARGSKPTTADAELCMKLFELRREAEMRKAREFVIFQFQPKNAEDMIKTMNGMGSHESAWIRMVFSFWEYAASLVLHDLVHPDLFLEWNGEMIVVYAKFAPFLKEMRQAMDYPDFWMNVQKVVTGSMEMRKRVAKTQQMLAKFAAAAQAASR